MKKNISLLLIIALFSINIVPSFATSTDSPKVSYAIDSSNLANQSLTQEKATQIESEIAILNNHYIDASIIKKIDVSENYNEYTLNYDEKVIVKSSNNKSTTIVASDGKNSNIICFMADGSLIIDGHKIKVSPADSTNTISKATYKGKKSLLPYGSKKASDYNDYLSSGKQNIALGQALDTLTSTALGTAISFAHGYIGIVVSLASVASAVQDVIININPKTEELGCKYTTYTSGAADYKYVNRFYADRSCKGTYSQQISYEHFIVY